LVDFARRTEQEQWQLLEYSAFLAHLIGGIEVWVQDPSSFRIEETVSRHQVLEDTLFGNGTIAQDQPALFDNFFQTGGGSLFLQHLSQRRYLLG